MITNTVITLYEFTSKVERQFIFFTDSVKCQQELVTYSESKRFWKTEVCLRTHFSLSSAKEIQGERDGRASGRLQVSRISSKTFKKCRLNSNLYCSKLKLY